MEPDGLHFVLNTYEVRKWGNIGNGAFEMVSTVPLASLRIETGEFRTGEGLSASNDETLLTSLSEALHPEHGWDRNRIKFISVLDGWDKVLELLQRREDEIAANEAGLDDDISGLADELDMSDYF